MSDLIREQICAYARAQLGTPFSHMGRQPGLLLDCAGLLIVTGRACGLVPADFDVPPYKERPDGDSLVEFCDAYMGTKLVNPAALPVGCGIIFRVARLGPPQHLGITYRHKYGGLGVVHAANQNGGGGRVIEHRLVFSPTLQFVSAYEFPGVG